MSKISELILTFLLNAAWQIAVIALVASVCAHLLRNAAARYRHALWLAALVLSLAIPVSGIVGPASEVSPPIKERPGAPLEARDDSSLNLSSPQAPDAADAGAVKWPAFNTLLRRHRQPLWGGSRLLLVLGAIYVLFILYALIKLWRTWRQTVALRRSAYGREIPAPLAVGAALCRNAFGLRNVTLLCSHETTVPFTVGTRRPVIILPESFYLEVSEETLTTVLGHEMAHVARRDFAINFICELLFLPISFHPLVKFMRRELNRTRELACDEMVTERLLEPVAYARALVRVASAFISPAHGTLTLGIFDADILEERIMRLTRRGRLTGPRVGRLLALTAFFLLCLSCVTISTFSFELQIAQAAQGLSAAAVPELSGAASLEVSTRSQSEISYVKEGRTVDGRGPAPARQELSSQSPQERAQSACELGRKQVMDMIPALVAMLGDDAPIEPLRCWDSGRWSPALDSFKQPSPGEQAAIALASMGTPAFKPLMAALNDGSVSARRNAAWAIGELTNMSEGERAEAVPALISLLGDSDDWVRTAAARALGEIRDERAVEPLVSALADGRWRVRALASWALSEMKEERAVEPLSHLLITDAQAEVRQVAAEALGEIRSRGAVSALNQALTDPEPRVRAKARWALSEIEDSEG